jgi:hypothetical protein
VKYSRYAVSLVLAGGVLVAVAVAVPYFPRGTDLYVHILWPWQVMRCLATGSLPVWLPDLNAEFGSPGIGLYSPLSPTICGALGLVFGTGGRGVRVALVLAALAMVAVAPGRSRGTRLAAAGLVIFSPAMLTEFFGRFPVAQLLAAPLAWLLIERAVARRWRWDRDGILLGFLWLMHAPTTVMVGLIGGVSCLAGSWVEVEQSDGGKGRRPFLEFGLATVVAAGLTVWHWWPLLAAAPDFPLGSALTGGEHHPLRNLIGVSGPHLFEINTAMGWAAIGLLIALLLSGAWTTRRGLVAVAAIALASLPSAPLWQVVAPLAWLQFPWRWMGPAALLPAAAVVEEAPRRGRVLLLVSIAAFLIPVVAVPAVQFAADPSLAVDTEPVTAGERVAGTFGGNPLLIDVREHRPLWWEDLGPTMALLGSRRAVVVPDGGTAREISWRPLRRKLEVESPQPGALVLRLLADRHWQAVVNQHPATMGRWGAAVAVNVPGGRNEVEVVWKMDPRASAGMVVSAVLLVGILISRRRRGLILRATESRL